MIYPNREICKNVFGIRRVIDSAARDLVSIYKTSRIRHTCTRSLEVQYVVADNAQ